MPANIKKHLALFDLDYTLLPLDSDQNWGIFTCKIGWADKDDFLQKNQLFYESYKAGTLNLTEYVRFATQAFRERGRQEALQARKRYVDEVIQHAIHPQALQLVRQHQQQGDLVAIVTATNRFIVDPICELFGVSEIIAVELETHDANDPTSWYTGEIRGVPSFQAGKITRVTEWLQKNNLDWESINSTFYSDSHNDLPLLGKVDNPIATNPDDTLRAVAVEKGWQILELFKP